MGGQRRGSEAASTRGWKKKARGFPSVELVAGPNPADTVTVTSGFAFRTVKD